MREAWMQGTKWLMRLGRRPVCTDDIPRGMTYEKYASGRTRALNFVWTLYGAGMVGVILCFSVVMVAAGRWADGKPPDTAFLPAASAAWMPMWFAFPAGCLARWRRHRDEVARAAGAANMDEFMGSAGATRHPILGWQWSTERETPQ